jgi:hypothetical protein
MKLPRSMQIVGIAAGSVILCAILVGVVDNVRTVYATPEMQTQFLRVYTPDRVLDRFRNASYSGGRGSGGGAGADLGFATHEKDVDQDILMNSADRPALMAALNLDLTALLTATGAKIVSDSSNDTVGIRLHYIVGNSEGTVTVKPFEAIPGAERYVRHPLGPGEILVWVHIVIDEKWFKAGVPSQNSAVRFVPHARQILS